MQCISSLQVSVKYYLCCITIRVVDTRIVTLIQPLPKYSLYQCWVWKQQADHLHIITIHSVSRLKHLKTLVINLLYWSNLYYCISVIITDKTILLRKLTVYKLI